MQYRMHCLSPQLKGLRQAITDRTLRVDLHQAPTRVREARLTLWAP
jgi:hypothetical protein